ncbi:MAG: hypothetical protein ABIH23_30270 [bacterium]
MHTETFEDIDVICLFSRPTEIAGPQVKPLRIRRKGVIHGDGQVYRVRKVTCQWSSMRGKFRRYHYSVLTDMDDIYELVFDSGMMQWKLRYEE